MIKVFLLIQCQRIGNSLSALHLLRETWKKARLERPSAKAIVATPSSIHLTPSGIQVSKTGERKEVFARERKEVDSLAWRTHRSVAPVKAKAIVGSLTYKKKKDIFPPSALEISLIEVT